MKNTASQPTRAPGIIDRAAGAFSAMMGDQAKAVAGATADLEAVRTRIAGLTAERERVTFLPVPLEVAVAAMDREIDATIARDISAVNINGLIRPFPGTAQSVNFYGRREDPAANWLGLIFLAGRAAIRAALIAEMERDYAGQTGITETDRAALIATISTEILDLELIEESMIRGFEAVGLPAQRRGEADLRAVLAFASDLPQ